MSTWLGVPFTSFSAKYALYSTYLPISHVFLGLADRSMTTNEKLIKTPGLTNPGTTCMRQCHILYTPISSFQFSSVQFKMVSMRSGKAHNFMRSTPSLMCFPNVAFETVPMLVWLTMSPLKERSLSASSFYAPLPQAIDGVVSLTGKAIADSVRWIGKKMLSQKPIVDQFVDVRWNANSHCVYLQTGTLVSVSYGLVLISLWSSPQFAAREPKSVLWNIHQINEH